MPSTILTDMAASITELKSNPMAVIRAAHGESVAILNHNEPAFYCVSPKMYEYLLELAEDAELVEIVKARENEPSYPVDLDAFLK